MTQDPRNPASRRAVLRTGLGVLSAGVATAALAHGMGGSESPLRRTAQTKIAQAQVQYQTTPKNGQMCSGCVNFEPPNACKIVAGDIVPNGWCVAYAPKSG